MSNKLGHLIDTRCGCGWDIHGKPNYREGHGIYSMSKDMVEEQCDVDLRNVVIKHQHCQDAYAYFVSDKGRPMLAAYRKRTDEENSAAAEAGVDSRATYIAEWLAGNFDRYAFEYMDSPFWQNIYRPVADYYANEEPLPLEEPIDAASVSVSNTTRSDIMAFVADGRANAVRAAVWAMLRQFDLPPAERKFLVIRDTEANVRKWVAAIGYSLPIQTANQISFNTCMEKLNQEADCCYYVQISTGMYVRNRNIQDPNQERRWYYMIAGAVPSDRSSDRTANPMPNVPYLVIDGAARQAKFETDQLMLRSYMKDIAANDASVKDFCNYMNEMQNIRLGAGLCDLYDALDVLTNEASWSYASFSKALGRFAPHFTRRSVLMRYVVSRLCMEGKYAEQFAAEDEQNNFNLLRALYKLVSDFEFTDGIPAIRRMLVNRIGALLGNGKNAEMLTAYSGCLKDMDEELYSAIAVDIIESTGLSMVTDADIASGSNAYVLGLFDMVGIYLRNRGMDWSSFFKGSDFSRLADALTVRSLMDEKMPGQILKMLSGDIKAIDSYVIRGCCICGDNNQMLRWWRTMLQNNVSAEYLCDLICSNNIGVQQIENVLCQELQINGYSENVKRLFHQYLARTPGAGNAFYRAWIKSVSGSKERAAALRNILTGMAANTNYARLLNEILEELDGEIKLETGKESSELAELVYEFALRTRTQCENALLWKYLAAMVSAKISWKSKDGIAGVFLRVNPSGYRFGATDSLLRSQLGKDFLMRMQEFDEDTATHIIALNSFVFDNASTHRAYVHQYARKISGDIVKKKNLALASVIYLREMVASGQLTGDQGTDKLREMYAPAELVRQLDELLAAIQAELSTVRTSGISERMVAVAQKEYGRDVSEIMDQMFADAQETFRQDHRGENFFTRLFGRKEDK